MHSYQFLVILSARYHNETWTALKFTLTFSFHHQPCPQNMSSAPLAKHKRQFWTTLRWMKLNQYKCISHSHRKSIYNETRYVSSQFVIGQNQTLITYQTLSSFFHGVLWSLNAKHIIRETSNIFVNYLVMRSSSAFRVLPFLRSINFRNN